MNLGKWIAILLALVMTGGIAYLIYRLTPEGEIIESPTQRQADLEIETAPVETPKSKLKFIPPERPIDRKFPPAPKLPETLEKAEKADPKDLHLDDLKGLDKNIDNLRNEIMALADEHCTREGAQKYGKILNCTLDIRGEPSVKDLKQCFEGIDPNDSDATKCADTVQEKRLQKYCSRDEEKIFKDLNSCMAKADVNSLMLKGQNEQAMQAAQECMKSFDLSSVSKDCLGKLTGLGGNKS